MPAFPLVTRPLHTPLNTDTLPQKPTQSRAKQTQVTAYIKRKEVTSLLSVQNQAAVTVYMMSTQLLLFNFAGGIGLAAYKHSVYSTA